jgi:spore germination cell wall hydrolase CwlJ-like protein
MRRRHRIAVSAVAARASAAVSLGAVVLIATPGVIAQQDVASLLLKSFDPSARWAISLSAGPGGETELVTEPLGEMGGSATVTAGGGSIVIQGVDPIVTGSVDSTAIIPDEDRIDRSWKGDLPMSVTTPATAPGFSAGSIMEEHSRLAPPDADAMPQVAFDRSSAPLSVLAIGKFIGPRAETTAVAELEPVPLPASRPNATMLVAAHYPVREIAPAAANAAAEAMIAAYAPDASVVDQDVFAALFTVPADKPEAPAFIPGPNDFSWVANPLPASAYTESEQQCLAEAIYFEARGEPYTGQVAVAQVVLNRVKNPAYPETICKVVYQNKSLRNACQFSFACDGIKDRVRPGFAWNRAKEIAYAVTFGGEWLDTVGTSTHYHATYVRPNWAGVFTKKAKIGRHVFYQTIYGGWS